MLSATDQTAIIAAMPGATSATVGSATITVDFRTESAPVMFSDGSVEQGKPYCVATAADVAANVIDHGTSLTIATAVWYVTGQQHKQDGMVRLMLSNTL